MKIAVLMSTYNGEKYLKEQIDSILNQMFYEGDELVLYIRDDGSNDQTLKIINDYAKCHNNVICINMDNQENLGTAKSFLSLLKTIYEFDSGIDYYAFSDQDDVWFEDKLFCALEKLRQSTNEKGALYYSNKSIVDSNLAILREDYIKFYGDFLEILWTSLVYGCTLVFDDKLAGYVLRHFPEIEILHDSWIYRVAKCIGTDVFFDEVSHIYYRQHESNVVGEEACIIHHGVAYMIKHFFSRMLGPKEHFVQNCVKEIAEAYSDVLDPSAKDYIELVIDYTNNFKNKFLLIRASEMRKRPVLTRMVWVYNVLFNMI